MSNNISNDDDGSDCRYRLHSNVMSVVLASSTTITTSLLTSEQIHWSTSEHDVMASVAMTSWRHDVTRDTANRTPLRPVESRHCHWQSYLKVTNLYRRRRDVLLASRVWSCYERTYCRSTPAAVRRHSVSMKLQPYHHRTQQKYTQSQQRDTKKTC